MVIPFLWKRQNALKEMPERAVHVQCSRITHKNQERVEKEKNWSYNWDSAHTLMKSRKEDPLFSSDLAAWANRFWFKNSPTVKLWLFLNSFFWNSFHCTILSNGCCLSHSAFSLLGKPDILSYRAFLSILRILLLIIILQHSKFGTFPWPEQLYDFPFGKTLKKKKRKRRKKEKDFPLGNPAQGSSGFSADQFHNVNLAFSKSKGFGNVTKIEALPRLEGFRETRYTVN